jgi:hypothetical protein
MKLLIYLSEATEAAMSIESTLSQIYEAASRDNPPQNIHGALFYSNGIFLQALEGPEDAVDALLVKLRTDPRHENLQVLVDQHITHHSMHEWNMQPINLEDAAFFSKGSLNKAIDMVSRSMKLDASMLVYLVQELLQEDDFRQLLSA